MHERGLRNIRLHDGHGSWKHTGIDKISGVFIVDYNMWYDLCVVPL